MSNCSAFKVLLPRFVDKVRIDAVSGCWLWTASRHHTTGYGSFGFEGKIIAAHRYSYRMVVGPIPEGLELDHLCANRACANPFHIEPVTHAENNRRSAARRTKSRGCGHTYDGVDFRGHRICTACHKASAARGWKAYDERQRALRVG